MDVFLRRRFRPRLRGTNLKPSRKRLAPSLIALFTVSVPDYGELILNKIYKKLVPGGYEFSFRPRLRGTNLKR